MWKLFTIPQRTTNFRKLIRFKHTKLLENLKSRTDEKRARILNVYIKSSLTPKLSKIPVNHLFSSNLCKSKGEKEDKCEPQVFTCSKTKDVCENNQNRKFKLARRELPEDVVLGFIPKTWALSFVSRTGHSGFYTFLFTFITYLFSKEIYVCDHDFYNGISLVIICIYAVKKQGPILARYLDKEVEKVEQTFENNLKLTKKDLQTEIDNELYLQESKEGELLLVQAKRENVHLQREFEFRRRQMEVYDEVLRILNYQVEVGRIHRAIQHKNLIQWVTSEVEKGLTAELKSEYLKICFTDVLNIIQEGLKDTKK